MDRTECVAGKVSKREAKIIEAAAKAEGVTVSQYVRTACLTTAVLDGNIEAIRYSGALLIRRVAARVEALGVEERVLA